MLSLQDIIPPKKYEDVRADFRRKALKAKEDRRMEFGPNFTFLFENDLTIQYQIQEMLRVERRPSEQAVLEEWMAYKDLLPQHDKISATLLIQYPDVLERKVMLSKLVGLDRHLHFRSSGRDLPVSFDRRQAQREKLSSVQFLSIKITHSPLSDLEIICSHPNYSYVVKAEASLVEALNSDLQTNA
jgi:hypothetical protein